MSEQVIKDSDKSSDGSGENIQHIVGSDLAVKNGREIGERILNSIDMGFKHLSDSEVKNESGPGIQKVRNSIQTLKQTIDASYLALGGLLYRVKHGRYFNTWGYDSFSDYTEEELGFRDRKARYLINIWKKFRVELNVSREDLQGVEWTKAAALKKVANKENVDDLIDEAKDKSVREVKEFVDDVQAEQQAEDLEEEEEEEVKEETGNEEVEKMHRDTFVFYDDQKDIVELAMSIAEEYTDNDREGYLLSMVATEYVASHTGKDVSMPWLLSRLQDVFDVRFIVLDEEEDDILMGDDVLESVISD